MEEHGLSKSPEYRAWSAMKTRCFNAKAKTYSAYGARGITVCDRWRDSFSAFYRDMGPKPSPQHTLDRYPNAAGDYEPGNCRWATRLEQSQNRPGFVIVLTHNGKSQTLAEWARELGVTDSMLEGRYHDGLPAEEILQVERRPSKLTRFITAKGETLSIRGWSRKTGLSRQAIKYRLDAGWPVEKALSAA